MEREERDAILAAGRYAESHWGARNTLAQSYKDEGID
jgi:hypothetical protein